MKQLLKTLGYQFRIEGGNMIISFGRVYKTIREIYEMALAIGLTKRNIIIDSEVIVNIHSNTELINIYRYEKQSII